MGSADEPDQQQYVSPKTVETKVKPRKTTERKHKRLVETLFDRKDVVAGKESV